MESLPRPPPTAQGTADTPRRETADGADPNALVDRSIEHGWKGLFPLNGSRADPADGIRQWLEHSTALEGEFTHDA